MHKVVPEKNVKHSMTYGHQLDKVFDQFYIVCENGNPGSVLQLFGIKNLVKTKCAKKKLGDIYQGGINKITQELKFNIAAKDEQINKFQITIQHLQKKDPSVSKDLKIQNFELKK